MNRMITRISVINEVVANTADKIKTGVSYLRANVTMS